MRAVPVHAPPMVGSVASSAPLLQCRTRLMAEPLALRKTCHFCFSFFDFRLMLGYLVYCEDSLKDLSDTVKDPNEMKSFSDQKA